MNRVSVEHAVSGCALTTAPPAPADEAARDRAELRGDIMDEVAFRPQR